MKYIDLTHTFTANMPAYPGDPKAELRQAAALEKDGFNDHELKTVMHVGTHMDAPLHMIAGGKKMKDMSPEKFFGRGILLDAREKKEIDIELLEEANIQKGDIVLIFTGHSKKYYDDDYFKNVPLLTAAFAQKLADYGIGIVGMDTPGPDAPPFPVHKILLSKETLIIENLVNLEALLNEHFEVIALPMKLDTDAAPCRVVARIL